MIFALTFLVFFCSIVLFPIAVYLLQHAAGKLSSQPVSLQKLIILTYGILTWD